MIRLLQWLFLGHVHKWKTTSVVELERPEGTYGGAQYGRRTGTRHIQQCETCGTVIKRDLI